MTTLKEAMLETARILGIVREGVATGGSVTTLIDTILDEPNDYFTKGTLWVLTSTNNAALCQVVKAYAERTITLTTAVSNAIVAGDTYAVAAPLFPKHALLQAVNKALRFEHIIKTDDTLTVTANTQEYSLLSGVSNVKRVDVATSTSVPYAFQPNFHVKEWNGKIVFDDGKEPTETGMKIRLWYQGTHGELAETGSLLPSVDMNWLKWAAATYALRDHIRRIEKDGQVDLELLNEAKTMEAQYAREAARHGLRSMVSDPKLGGW